MRITYAYNNPGMNYTGGDLDVRQEVIICLPSKTEHGTTLGENVIANTFSANPIIF